MLKQVDIFNLINWLFFIAGDAAGCSKCKTGLLFGTISVLLLVIIALMLVGFFFFHPNHGDGVMVMATDKRKCSAVEVKKFFRKNRNF